MDDILTDVQRAPRTSTEELVPQYKQTAHKRRRGRPKGKTSVKPSWNERRKRLRARLRARASPSQKLAKMNGEATASYPEEDQHQEQVHAAERDGGGKDEKYDYVSSSGGQQVVLLRPCAVVLRDLWFESVYSVQDDNQTMHKCHVCSKSYQHHSSLLRHQVCSCRCNTFSSYTVRDKMQGKRDVSKTGTSREDEWKEFIQKPLSRLVNNPLPPCIRVSDTMSMEPEEQLATYRCDKCEFKCSDKADMKVHTIQHMPVMISKCCRHCGVKVCVHDFKRDHLDKCEARAKFLKMEEMRRARRREEVLVKTKQMRELKAVLRLKRFQAERRGQHVCDMCGFRVKTLSKLSVHKNKHCTENIYKCRDYPRHGSCVDCDFVTKHPTALWQHYLVQHAPPDEKFSCPGCGYLGLTYSMLSRHWNETHYSKAGKLRVCRRRGCNYTAQSDADLDHHRQTCTFKLPPAPIGLICKHGNLDSAAALRVEEEGVAAERRDGKGEAGKDQNVREGAEDKMDGRDAPQDSSRLWHDGREVSEEEVQQLCDRISSSVQSYTGDCVFTCHLCGLGLPTRQELNNHKREQHSTSTCYQCCLCPFGTNSSLTFLTHQSEVHNDSPLSGSKFICPAGKCHYRAAHFGFLQKHWNRVHRWESRHRVAGCDQSAEYYEDLIRCGNGHVTGRNNSGRCVFVCDSEAELRRHRRECAYDSANNTHRPHSSRTAHTQLVNVEAQPLVKREVESQPDGKREVESQPDGKREVESQPVEKCEVEL